MSLKGQLILAMPGLVDPNFHKSVTCISEHTAEGAIGIVVNQIHTFLKSSAIFEELDLDYSDRTADLPIHIGGPVNINEIFVLHGLPLDWGKTFVINPELALSNSIEIIRAIAQGQGPESFIISLGYAGWGAGQLENELKQNAWLTSPYCKDIVFGLSGGACWEEAIKNIGIDPIQLSDTPGHA